MFLGAVVLGFVLVSCGPSKKDKAITMCNDFFTQEIAEIQNVNDLDGFVAYDEASNHRFAEFFDKMDEEYPLTDDDRITTLSEEDSKAVMQAYNEKYDTWYELYSSKGAEYYEPILADLEDYFDGKVTAMAEAYGGDLDNVPDEVVIQFLIDLFEDEEFNEKYDLASEYSYLCNEEQFDRFYDFYDLVEGDEPEEEEE